MIDSPLVFHLDSEAASVRLRPVCIRGRRAVCTTTAESVTVVCVTGACIARACGVCGELCAADASVSSVVRGGEDMLCCVLACVHLSFSRCSSLSFFLSPPSSMHSSLFTVSLLVSTHAPRQVTAQRCARLLALLVAQGDVRGRESPVERRGCGRVVVT